MWVDHAVRRIAADHIFPEHTHAFIVCSTDMRRRMNAVRDAFNDAAAKLGNASNGGESSQVKFVHAFACKANPLQAVLEVCEANGFACETASYGEFLMASRVFPEDRVVFDSPVKTIEELRAAVQTRCFLNVDNFDELQRIVDLRDKEGLTIHAKVGLRINPQIGAGAIAELSTATKTSKFGIGLNDYRKEILDAFAPSSPAASFLCMLHVHSGSQGLPLNTLTDGVAAVVALADELGADRVKYIDIGGGFPVDFSSDVGGDDAEVHTDASNGGGGGGRNDSHSPAFRDYVHQLQQRVPTLFSNTQRTILTEFGRSIVAKAGILVSRVEYTKLSGGRTIVQQHVGADLAVRTVWQPSVWPLRVDIYDADGNVKACPASSPDSTVSSVPLMDIAGPCCNGGCVIARGRPLPHDSVVAMRDLVVARDVGGYYHSSFSTYNMRQMPACFMYDLESDTLECVRTQQTVEETVALFETRK